MKYKYKPDYVVAPGETLKEIMKEAKVSKRKMASVLNVSIDVLSRILNGEQLTTEEISKKLEYVTGVPSKFWNDMEKNYRVKLKEEVRLWD